MHRRFILVSTVCIQLLFLEVESAQVGVLYAREGDTVSLWCNDRINTLIQNSQDEELRVSWYRNVLESRELLSHGRLITHPLLSNTTFRITKNYRLNIQNVGLNDDGEYDCEIFRNSTTLRRPTILRVRTSDRFEGGLWPHGLVPYIFGTGVLPSHAKLFEEVFSYIIKKTCVKFEPFDPENEAHGAMKNLTIVIDPDTEMFEESYSCYSYDEDASNLLRLGSNSISMYSVFKEIFRVLCIPFELERRDRDDYITFNEDRPSSCHIPREARVNKHKSTVLYDYLSITHPPCPGDSCLIPKIPGVQNCGQRPIIRYMSVLDVEKINEAYNCKGCYALAFRPKDSQDVRLGTFVQTDKYRGICRKYVAGGDISPGDYDPRNGQCNVAGETGSSKNISDEFEVLINPGSQKYVWIMGSNQGLIGNNPIAGGRDNKSLYLYFCRCKIGDQYIGGKFSSGVCTVAGMDDICYDYELLDCQPTLETTPEAETTILETAAYISGSVVIVLLVGFAIIYYNYKVAQINRERSRLGMGMSIYRAPPHKSLPSPELDYEAFYDEDYVRGNEFSIETLGHQQCDVQVYDTPARGAPSSQSYDNIYPSDRPVSSPYMVMTGKGAAENSDYPTS